MSLPFAPASLVERIGWLLVHSVWEFALIALLLAMGLRVLRGAAPGVRYSLALLGWGAMLVAPAATWFALPETVAIVGVPPGGVPPVGVPPSGGRASMDSLPAEAGTPTAALFAVGIPPSGSPLSALDSQLSALRPLTSDFRQLESLRALIAPWLNTLVVVWCLGVCAFAARSARGWFVVRRLLQRDVTPPADELAALLAGIAQRLGLRGPVRLLQSSRVAVPLVVGWLRPVILLPVCVATGFSPPQLEAILAHELAHIRRHDYLINLLQNLSETVLFYHPAVWWASAVVRREREHCCDELAARALGNRAEYGRALLALEELRGTSPSLALGAKGGSLLERIRRLAQREPTPRLGAGGVVGIALVAAVAVGGAVWGAGGTEGRDRTTDKATARSTDTVVPPQPTDPDPKRPFVVRGRVTDESGQPLLGVVVTAHAGVGTLFTTGTATTTADGTYTLRFGPGIHFARSEDAPLSVGFQAATIIPQLSGWYEVNLHQQGNLAMTDTPRDESEKDEQHGYEGIVRPNAPYEVSFVMARGAAIEGRFINEFRRPVAGESIALDGEDLPPSSSALDSATTNDAGEFQFDGVPLNRNWHFTVRIQGTRHELSGPQFRFEKPESRAFEISLETTESTDGKVELRLEQTEKEDSDAVSASRAAGENTQATVAETEQTSEASSEPMTTLTGVVVDERDQPVAGARLESQFYSRGKRTRATATSGGDGRFELIVPTDHVDNLPVLATSSDQRRMAIVQIPWDQDVSRLPALKLTLKPALPVQVKVRDGDGRPVSGATATFELNWSHVVTAITDAEGVADFLLPADAEFHSVHAWKDGLGLDYKAYFSLDRFRSKEPQVRPDLSQPVQLALTGVKPATVTLIDADSNQPIPDTRVYIWILKKPGEADYLNVSSFTDQLSVRTDAQGHATFNWLPEWQEISSVTVWASSDDHDRQRGEFRDANGTRALTMRLNRLVPLSGRVTLPDGGPAAGITLQVSGAGYTYDTFREEATTGADGRYEIKVAPNQAYLVVVQDRTWAAPPATGFVVRPGQPKENVDLRLRPATRIFGRVTLGPDQRPVERQVVQIGQVGAEVNTIQDSGITPPRGNNQVVQPTSSDFVHTDAEGRFEFFVGPGQFHLSGPRSSRPHQFTITTDTEREFNFYMDRPAEGPLTGIVVTGDPPQPVPNAKICGVYKSLRVGRDIKSTADAQGRFHITRDSHSAVLHAESTDRALVGIIEIGPDDESATIPLRPFATYTGRLIDGESNQPAAKAGLIYHISVPQGDGISVTSFAESATTNDKGEFSLPHLVAGQKYQLMIITSRDQNGSADHTRHVMTLLPEKPGETIELGDVVVKPDPPPYKPPTPADRITTAFHKPDVAATRYQNSLRDIRIGHLRLLLILADPEADLTQQFFTLRYEDDAVRVATDNYWLTPLPLTGEKADDTRAFAASMGIEISDPGTPVFLVIDEAEQRLATVAAADLSTDGAIDRQKVLDLLAAYVPEQLDAQVLFDEALARAKAENKRVFLQESATWCGPCWMLSRFIHTHRDVLEQDYIFVKLDHRWPHAQEIAKKFQSAPGGIPWCAILDADQHVLATSDGPDGNIGFPAKEEPQGIEHFLKMLRDSRIRLTDAELDGIGAALRGEEPLSLSAAEPAAVAAADPPSDKPAAEASAADSEKSDPPPYPVLVSTEPMNGAVDVDPSLEWITVTFDRDMSKGMSWTGEIPVDRARKPVWKDARTCVLPVILTEGTAYRIGINSRSYRNFASKGGEPTPPTAIYFATRGATEAVQQTVRVPKIVSLEPVNGAMDVDPAITQLTVTFDMPMGDGMSWVGGGEDFPTVPEGQTGSWSEDRRTCTLPVVLKPGHTYRLGLNAPKFQNFQSAHKVPLAPVMYTFTTRKSEPDQDADGGSTLLREIRAKSAPLLAALAEKHGYGLKEGEDVKRVPMPFDPARLAYYRVGHPGQSDAIPRGPDTMLFHWQGSKLINWRMSFGDSENPGASVAQLCEWILDRKSQDVEGPSELLRQVVPGDWVLRLESTGESRLAQLNAILARDAPVAVRLSFRSVERAVYVVSGDYKLTPLPGKPGELVANETDRTVTRESLHIFGQDDALKSTYGGGGCGDFDEFLAWLGRWIKAPIVGEVTTGPSRELCWRMYDSDPSTEDTLKLDHDPERVLANITKQTGLTFEKANREVRILFVEPAPRSD